MRHLRSDYDAIQPWPVKRPHIAKDIDTRETALFAPEAEYRAVPLIEEDEPVFLLRAKDPVAAATVAVWADLAREAGADEELVQRVLAWSQEMTCWREEHYPDRQHPDTPSDLLRQV